MPSVIGFWVPVSIGCLAASYVVGRWAGLKGLAILVAAPFLGLMFPYEPVQNMIFGVIGTMVLFTPLGLSVLASAAFGLIARSRAQLAAERAKADRAF